VLPGVDVVVNNANTGVNRAGVTDGNGYFTMTGLPPQLLGTLPAFRRHVMAGVPPFSPRSPAMPVFASSLRFSDRTVFAVRDAPGH
jgi:hypothetical protein